ncbi:MAG: elongation factor Ts [Chlorobi bacterium]|nr:elongation factor Ts [Chlorobiota bacterium]
MVITAQQVRALREQTGAGMMDCKKALTEAEGDFEKAVELLRKRGAAMAAKRADREAKEGIVLASVEGNEGYMVEVNCETDFVARSDDFIAFAKRVLDIIKSGTPASVEELLTLSDSAGTLADALNEATAKIGEKIQIKRFASYKAENGVVIDYIHPGSKLGVLLELSVEGSPAAELTEVGRNIAMQIAAMNPLAVSREDLAPELVEKEKDIYRQQALESGKPENIVDRIVEGRMQKYYQENCLLEQTFIRDNNQTVKEYLEDVSGKLGTPVGVARYHRFQIGAD